MHQHPTQSGWGHAAGYGDYLTLGAFLEGAPIVILTSGFCALEWPVPVNANGTRQPVITIVRVFMDSTKGPEDEGAMLALYSTPKADCASTHGP